MSTRPWEAHVSASVDEINALRNPWDRFIVAQDFRDLAALVYQGNVRHQMYRLRLESGLSWEGIGERVLLSPGTCRGMVARWCEEHDAPVPSRTSLDVIRPETVRDLTHLQWSSQRLGRQQSE